MRNVNKRIISALVLVITGIAIIVYYAMSGENKSAEKSLFAMDTYMEITAYGRNGERAVQACADEINRLDALLSTGSDTSEVTYLNKNKSGTLSEDTEYLLKRSLEIYDMTDGAFDITVYPVMAEWGFTTGEFKVPDSERLSELIKYVDASKLEYDSDTHSLSMPKETEIDFGGIAKGYTSARVADIMKEYGIKSAKLNLGGNVQTVGAKNDGSKWRVGIKNPDETLDIDYLGVVSVEDKAVITSGGYERYFEEGGITYHHIIDTDTGYPADSGLVSVTVVSDDGTLADGLSTALYCMGADRALEFWRAHSDKFDAILYDNEGKLYVTEGIEKDFYSELDVTVISG
jgi:thiamine biosynthesis lipoprotein